MNTLFITSVDGTQIAYNVTGQGPALILLHGGRQNRQNWHELGYVERLKDDFKVITIDIRGNGESDKPVDPADYTTDKMSQDILAVAAACGAEQFTIWGFSYGGNIGRYLAAQSNRVAKMIIMGIPFGLGASGEFRHFIEQFRAYWSPILQAQREGTLDIESLDADERHELQHGNIPLALAWLSAMLDWSAIEPADLRCPTLWLIGSENKNTLANLKEYEASLQGTQVQVQVVEGLTHNQELTEVDRVLPIMVAFTQS
jgi:pimeloyl-ACP methyl ester carboxylesterase